ncbi:unnamed protein product [Trichobilharzia regenti]|nr:unnamed protein product [Trichobilharzia regenti]
MRVQGASVIANRLSSSELLSAFQISFHLMEKISDVMLSVCTSRGDSDERTSPQTTWKYPNYSRCMTNDDSPIGVCSMKTQSTSENGDCEADQQESQLKVIIGEEQNFCYSNVASSKNDNSTEFFEKLTPGNENHIPNNSSNKCLSSPVTNDGSSVLDIDENYSSTDKCGISATSRVSDDETKSTNSENNSKAHLKRQTVTKTGDDRQYEYGHAAPSEVTNQNNFDLNSSQTTNKFHIDTKRWRLTSADKLNTLIDECERQINGRKLYVCKFCGKIYEIKSSMRYHMKIIHLQMHLRTTEMQCRICGKQFTCVSAVNRHQSKCILSSLAESRMQKNTSNQFITSPTASMAEAETNCHIPLNSFTPQTIDNCKINSDLNHALPFSDSNAILGSLNSSELQNVNFQSAFRVPEVCTVINQPVPAGNNLQTGLDVKNLVPQSHFLGFPNKFEKGDPKDFNFPSASCNILPFLSPANNNSMDSLNPQGNSSIWPSMSTLGSNFPELTPEQIDICMKAVFHGICSTVVVEQCTTNNNTTNQDSNISSQTSSEGGTLKIEETQWEEPSKRVTETQRGLTTQKGEMAIDLSSRPRSASLMIESF